MKKNIIYLLCVTILLTSCSSAYKTSQTPDDVYYSPAKKIYPSSQYQNYGSSDDAYLHMKVQDHNRWAGLDDYEYWNDSRYYYNNYYNPWNTYFSWSSWYNPYYSYWYNPWASWYSPYCTVVYYKNPTVYYGGYSGYHLSTYNNRTYNTTNLPLQNGNRNLYNNTNNSSANRHSLFNTNQNQTNSNPVRTFNSGSTHSNSGGGRISGGGARTRPPGN